MTNAEFYANLPADVAYRDVLVDGEKNMMTIYLYNILCSDEEFHNKSRQRDAQQLIDLAVGGITIIDTKQIKRLS